MAITTINEKGALMMLGLPWGRLPISADGIDQADKQQLLNEYPGVTWGELAPSRRKGIPWIPIFWGGMICR